MNEQQGMSGIRMERIFDKDVQESCYINKKKSFCRC